MGSLRHQAPAIENKNAIGIADRCQAVGDDQGCAVGRELFQCLLNE